MSTSMKRLEGVVRQLSPSYVAGTMQDRNVVSITSIEDGVAIITIDNPPINSLAPKVMKGLKSCYDGIYM